MLEREATKRVTLKSPEADQGCFPTQFPRPGTPSSFGESGHTGVNSLDPVDPHRIWAVPGISGVHTRRTCSSRTIWCGECTRVRHCSGISGFTRMEISVNHFHNGFIQLGSSADSAISFVIAPLISMLLKVNFFKPENPGHVAGGPRSHVRPP
ncbi:hypothetical protein BD410DRAFT_498696 [Rickenella mellea]|uniref:Uncharacterized protein n=1 Tax=Rickenella mellea TaxID=50990 RepID=A0A4Y7PTY0_9AGAM|nr:hypothetical protein BD410DRAFT_498696 [Rickenella mellea]